MTLFILVTFQSVSISAIAKKEAVVLSSSVLTASNSSSSVSQANSQLSDYTLNLNAQCAIVVEAGRGMELYLKNPEKKTSIPAASKIMTAVIALETLPLETKITISNVAADQRDAYVLSLQTGEKYSLEYLLYGLILKDNNAAAVAIAEQISGVEEEFVNLMNNKAISYQMMNTFFKNSTGELDDAQYTTVSDVARLVRFALTDIKFEMILETKDIPFFLSENKSKHLYNNLERAWSLIDTTTGAFQSVSGDQSSFIATSSSGGIHTITVAATTSKSKILTDLATISDSIFADYEFSALVLENQFFPKTIEVGTNTIQLKFSQTINYVHPRDVDYIKSTIYEDNEIIEYPVLTTKSVAKVTFELMDGTKITADLYPAVTIWGESNYFQKLLSLYNSNRDTGIIIIISLSFLLLLCVYHIIRLIVKLIRFIFRKPNINQNP
jgi:serine-type D-Ala-D-Ala carboxypeptidase (penicillin-binding protein 5/6)